ncbi:hypothetical protein JYT84_00875 [bacterium AH-315-M10]|nr:hypothetical protein [bacterium AH-315-M10]
MAAVAILAIALMGLISAIMSIMRLNELARLNTLATSAAKTTAAEVEGADFSTAYGTYNGYTFDVAGLTAKQGDPDGKVGLVTVDNTNPDLLVVKILLEWRGRSGNYSMTVDLMVVERK